jgi:hypothetical protein
MTCTSGTSYIIKSGDTLEALAQQKLQHGSRWQEIKKPNGTPFTEEEARRLQVGQEVCLPVFGGDTSKGSFQDMLEALGAFESGLPKGDPNQYRVENSLGFMGKYQFGEPLLIDLGYYKADVYYGKGADKNYWRGTWTGKKAIDSKAKFLDSSDVQEFAIREAFSLNWQRLNDSLRSQGKSVNDYLGQQSTFKDGGVLKTITITLSGILAGAHLRGPYGVADLLLKNLVTTDEYGTSILRYVEGYGGYDVKPEDFLNPVA